jgi:hypothetical protein
MYSRNEVRDMGERFLECEHSPEEGLTIRFKPSSFHLLPDATMGHVRTAKKEVLLAVRSLLDVAIERLEKEEKVGGQGPTKIDVQ